MVITMNKYEPSDKTVLECRRYGLLDEIDEISKVIESMNLDKQDIEYKLFEVEREIDRLAYEDEGIF